MKKTTLLAVGAWALGLLAGLFAWLSPDSAFFPGPRLALVVVASAVGLLLVGAVMAGVKGVTGRASVAATLAATAPLVGAALALIFAARGLLPHPALPLLFVVLFGLGQAWWARGRSSEPISWRADLGVSALVVVSMFIVLPALLLGAAGQAIWSIAVPSYGNAVARAKVTDVLAQYRPAPRVGITAEAAAMALQAIGNTGTDRREELVMDAPGSSSRPWVPTDGPFSGWPGDSVMRHALTGLTKAEREWLQPLGTHPGLALFDTVAYAALLDPWGALKTPLPAGLNVWSLPIPSFRSLQGAARLQLYRVALAAADRKPGVADSLTRSAIGFGLRLRDDSDLLIGTLIGSTIAREGGLALAALWRAGGKRTEADALVAALQYPPREAIPESTPDGPSPRELRARVIQMARDGTEGRAVRWEHLSLLGISRCATLREMLYGPSPAVREAFAAAAPMFQRSPKEREVFERLSLGVISSEGVGELPPVFRFAAVAFGHRPVAACAQAIFGVGM